MREFIEGGLRFVQEFRIGQIIGAERFAVVAAYPIHKGFVQSRRQLDALVHGGQFVGRQDDAQSQAGGAAAVAHALADIDIEHRFDWGAAFGESV